MAMPYWLPKAEGPLGELPPTLASLRSFKDQVLLMGGLADEAGEPGQGRRRPRALGRHVPDLRAVQDHRRRRRVRRGVDGSDRRAGVREADAAGVARARHRIQRDARRLRRRRELRLHEHHRVAHADHAAADRERSARGVRAAVRHERQHRRAARARPHQARPQHPRFRRRPRCGGSSSALGPTTRPSSTSTSTRCATSSAASRRPRSRTRASCRSSISRWASRPTTPSTPS